MKKILIGLMPFSLAAIAALAAMSAPAAAEATDFYFGISSGRSAYPGARSSLYARPSLYGGYGAYPLHSTTRYRTAVPHVHLPAPRIHYHPVAPRPYYSARPSLYSAPRAVYRNPRSCYGY